MVILIIKRVYLIITKNHISLITFRVKRIEKMYVPNLRKASRNMTKHMFRDKNAESQFPHHTRYVPHAEDNVFTYRNPSTILGALSKELIQLRQSAEEEVIRKRLINTIFW
jgi:hypothetical protein